VVPINRVPINRKKAALAGVLGRSGLSSLMLRAQMAVYGPHCRAINYHDVPPEDAPLFEAQLRWYRDHFRDVGPQELDDVLAGRFGSGRPGLLISFDDGLRSAAEVAAPLLEEYGFTGWFMVPPMFIDAPVPEQAAFAREHQIEYVAAYPDERVAMTWDQLRDLSRRHVVTCHSMTHRRLGESLSLDDFEFEINASKKLLEQALGASVEGFTWVGGEESSYSEDAARVIRESGYRYGFMTNNLPIREGCNPLQLQRTNVESWFPLDVVRFQLSGFLDATYAPKRSRVNALTG
jgi:peptidoglycan/xylan/chitin deacetylase (PgdA/CDA1 family)